jgi:aryl-alcohol dehydrogenase-like predicted oxidoreductase
MVRQAKALTMKMERTEIPGTSLRVSPVAIGTWAIGGWMWGGTDEAESVATIQAALEHGISVVDTAPVYGFGPLRGDCWQGDRRKPATLPGRKAIAD